MYTACNIFHGHENIPGNIGTGVLIFSCDGIFFLIIKKIIYKLSTEILKTRLC